ncbi:MAG TPA: SMC-Scp complex subunit ScpB [Alphaproteobacteria bacterium]|jgi:segregation and condensation protein B|nr:SMC-Scp complex subunit ScpB [Alphaproteobacteria bacterium]HIK87028.1 SMC-Scp complex subunit ScpB [Alphaproteobacteria bacterium]
MNKELYIKIAEAIIFTSDKPVSIRSLTNRLPETTDISFIIDFLLNKYKEGGFLLERIGDTLAFRSSSEIAKYLTVEKTIHKKLSKAALEILAIIAYHQPITRAEIEDMRGVSVSQGSLDVLFEFNWVEPRGYKAVPGRPSTWRTTRDFLDHFGLESIKDLPGISELKASGLLSRNIGPSVLSRDNITDL